MKRGQITKYIIGSTLLLLILIFGIAQAVHDLYLFELDRDAVNDPSVVGDDWSTLYGGGGSSIKFTGILADVGAPGTQFQGGGSKDDLDITSWLWKYGEPLDKDDITNAYAAAYINTTDTGNNDIGDLIFYFGLDRFSSNGSAQVGFWFLQDPNFGLTNISSGGGYKFSGAHMDGDVLVQSNFSRGGVIDSITVYKWFAGGLMEVLTAADCVGPPASPADDPACATVNRSPQIAPWPYTPKSNEGSPNIFLTGAFFEGGLNISYLVPEAGCFTGFLAETRTSTPFDARLKDFVTGNLDLCSLSVTKTGDDLSKVGDDVNYSIIIENTGGIRLYKDDISDTLLGDISIDGVDQTNDFVVSNGCGASLLPDASCEIVLQRTVQESDPDPLPNTVNVTYRGKADLSGQAVSGSDDHSVNLFQPGVSVEKTGDTLSKVGDDVDYTITVTNTSSSDSPDLVNGTISDTLLGNLLDPANAYVTSKTCTATLATSASCVIYATRTVLNTDPDPLPNTVTVHYNPSGFPNDITDNASHSVNLFQPSVDVTKTGDALSKVGDSVDYTITITNTSSSDSPYLVNGTITDTLLGDLLDPANSYVDQVTSTCTTTLATGANCVIYATRTVLNTDPDPLPNTVTVHYNPSGFPNDITDNASHSVNLFQPSVDVAKTGDALSKVGDSVDYTITVTNTSSSDSPDLVNGTISDTLLGNLLDPANAYVTSKTCTATLATSASCVIYATRTVLNTDPDPLPNTVTVHYNPSGFPNDITDQSSHSVNLFQPAINVVKTGDTLSKIGDPVNYTFTLSNNSSADTPALTCTATDTLLGSIFSGTLPLGDTVINRSRTVQPTDPDPLGNTVTLNCSIAGFPNTLTKSDSHSTNLFQPSVMVTKSGPGSAFSGETITYSFTIQNTSSTDSPNLILDSMTDTVLGTLTSTAAANGCSTLAPGASCSFTFDYTIQSTDPNPLVNVVTVHYHPVGFPNDVTDEDDHSLDILTTMGCTPGFWQGGAGSGLWDEVIDPQWVYGGTNPFIHTTLFNDFFDLYTDSRLDGKSMWDLVSTGGTEDWAIKAGRDMVAAYLNESAFPGSYPAASLDALTTMWYDAVLADDSGFEAFHILVSNWNSPSGGTCPLP